MTAPRPLRITKGYMHGNCMRPAWNNGDLCLIAEYPPTWETIAALHGKFCRYDFRGNRAMHAHGGILDHVEMIYPDGEQVLVFRTLDPTDHETIRKLPMRLLTYIGQIYPLDEAHLIPQPAEPEPQPEVVEVEIEEPAMPGIWVRPAPPRSRPKGPPPPPGWKQRRVN